MPSCGTAFSVAGQSANRKSVMLRTIPGWLVIALSGFGYLQVVQAQSSPVSQSNPVSLTPSPHRSLLDRYCVVCHNERLKTAGLMLDKMDVDHPSEGAEVWEKVVRKLRTGAMPPAGMPRPDQSGYDSLATFLETELDRSAAANPNPGRTATLHRLNRAEYTNAVRDLLALDVDAIDLPSLLPADDSGYGFDNIGEVLSVSPVLLERYMSAADKVARLALGRIPSARPGFATYEVSKFLKQDDRVSENLPFGSRGGIAIRHYFPADGEYVIKARLRRSYDGEKILGLAEPSQIEFRLDGMRIKTFALGAVRREGPESEQEPDAGLELRIPVKAGTRLVGVAFPEETWAPEKDSLHEFGFVGVGLKFDDVDQPALSNISIAGPYNPKGLGDTPSRRKILVCAPPSSTDEEGCARKIFSTLARRAYRRPVTDQDIAPLIALYQEGRKRAGFESGVEMALQRLLVSPEFLFRIERDSVGAAPGTAYRLNDVELASRLSFFLWSSIPDDELLNVAVQGKLKNVESLEQQVHRMLADPRSKALSSNFAGQWLYLRNVRSVLPDVAEYPDFDENLREAFEQETGLFFESMLREDHSVLDLLRADYTFLNERLARHYGIPGIYGSHFRRVTLSDENRKGLLGQGSILMVTSYANRTSPTIRGKWLLENLLGAPPPAPPPNVPSLMDRGEDGKILSMREQMEKHRANPACAVCHKNMDPLGFALENFDAIGKWRTTSGAANTPVDASGVLPDGTKFNGPAELRRVLLSKSGQFANTVTEKLLTYALGRGIEYYDAPAVRKILRGAAPAEYRWSSLITGIVKSDPFQMRRSRQP
jgi:mono/diheme cytochrome c family protein